MRPLLDVPGLRNRPNATKEGFMRYVSSVIQ